MRTKLIVGIAALLVSIVVSYGQKLGDVLFYPTDSTPVGYRGDGTGIFPGAIAPTTSWIDYDISSGVKGNNIIWKTELNGLTASSPIVIGDKVITLEEPNFVVCINANTGVVLWRYECDHLTLYN